MIGRVTRFDPDRGVGSIKAGDVPEGFIVSANEVRGSEQLDVGQAVHFDAVLTERGLRATNVVPGRKPASPLITHTAGSFAMATVAALFYVLGFGLHWLLAWLLAVNLVTFFYYGWDKRVAQDEQRRIPERTLHYLAAAGGSLGGILGRRVFRHKTRKGPFLVRSWTIIAIQIVALLAYIRVFGADLPL